MNYEEVNKTVNKNLEIVTSDDATNSEKSNAFLLLDKLLILRTFFRNYMNE